MARSVLLKIVVVISGLVVLVSLLSLIHDLSFWYAKILDFPRTQYLIISLICLILFLLVRKKRDVVWFSVVAGLLIAISIQAFKIAPYFIGEKVVPQASPRGPDSRPSLKILIANVLISNRNAAELLELVKKTEPDIFLGMEVDNWWIGQLDELDFPHVMKHPLDNAYGMVLYSKLPLLEREVMYFQHADVPSFHATVELASGHKVKFHGVHPVAPVPSQKYPDNVGLKEVALPKVGKMVAADSLPSIVAGDFNDVSWSSTTRLFEENGNLKNVRLGRGLFNSFSAHSFWMRWPLDHFFVTKEFRVIELERLDKFGSDHFPMLAEFEIEYKNN